MKKKIIYILLVLVLVSAAVFVTWFFINNKDETVTLESFTIYGVEIDVNDRHVFQVDLKDVDIKKPNVTSNACISAFNYTCSKGNDCLNVSAMSYDKSDETMKLYFTIGDKANYNTNKNLKTYGTYDYYVEVYNINKDKVKEAGYCFDEYVAED